MIKVDYDGFSKTVCLTDNTSKTMIIPEVDFLVMIQEYNRQKQSFIETVFRPRSYYVPQEEPNNSSRLDKIICLLEKIERRIK